MSSKTYGTNKCLEINEDSFKMYIPTEEHIMVIEALLNVKDCPLPLAVDMYEKTILPSIEDESMDDYNEMIESLTYDYFSVCNKEENAFVDWSLLKNKIAFSPNYFMIFEDPEIGLWIAYEALLLVFTMYPDHYAADYQPFAYKDNDFCVHAEGDHVIIFAPEDF